MATDHSANSSVQTDAAARFEALRAMVRRRAWRDRLKARLPGIGEPLTSEHNRVIRELRADTGQDFDLNHKYHVEENVRRAILRGDGAEDSE